VQDDVLGVRDGAGACPPRVPAVRAQTGVMIVEIPDLPWFAWIGLFLAWGIGRAAGADLYDYCKARLRRRRRRVWDIARDVPGDHALG